MIALAPVMAQHRVAVAFLPVPIRAVTGEIQIGRAWFSLTDAAELLGIWHDHGAPADRLRPLRAAILEADRWQRAARAA